MERTHSFGYWLRRRRKALSHQLDDLPTLAWFLAGLGTVAAQSRRPERAARPSGCRAAPAARAAYERALAAPRTQIAEADFAAAWAAVRALTLEQAVAHALDAESQHLGRLGGQL
jgi:hypothetical protein